MAALLLLLPGATVACGGTSPAPARVDAAIVVSGRGSDQGAGTAASPFRTLKQALSVAQAGDTIQLEAGDYTAASGESWGYRVPAGITLRGDSAATTRLLGPQVDGGAGLVVSDGLKLQQLGLDGFETGLEQTEPGELTLSQVSLSNCRAGVFVDESAGSSRTVVDGSQLAGGIFIGAPDSTLSISKSDVVGAVNFGGTRVDVSHCVLHADTSPYGISLRAGALSVTDSSISGGNYGIYQLTGSSSLRRTQLSDYASIGFYFASGALDLGTQTEAGDNAFVGRDGASGAFGMYVDTGAQPATASNTSFNGVIPPASVVQAGDSEIAEPGAYFVTPGQRLTFFRVPEP